MSRRKIKTGLGSKKKSKGMGGSMKHAMEIGIQMKRAVRKEDENSEVVALVTEEKLDLDKQHDYKYMAAIAKEMDWSVGRLMKTTERVTRLLKEEAEEKENE